MSSISVFSPLTYPLIKPTKLKEIIKQTATKQQIKKIKQQQHHKITLGGLGCYNEFVPRRGSLYQDHAQNWNSYKKVFVSVGWVYIISLCNNVL